MDNDNQIMNYNDKDWTPYINMEFNTIDEAWEYWCHYEKQVGFCTRKGFVNRSKLDDQITSRKFVCSKEGVRQEDKRRVHSKHRDETRTNCHARLLVRLVRESEKYTIYDFVAKHNHQLHLPQTTYMMRSQRRISKVQARAIDLIHSAGIHPKDAHELMSREASGRDSLGYMAGDQKTYLRTRREKAMKYGAAGSILRYFQDEQIKEVVWLKSFLLDLEVVPSVKSPITLYCDNSGAVANSKEPRIHKRAKHIERKYHLIRDIVKRGDVIVTKIASEDNLADLFTKSLPTKTFDGYVEGMRVRIVDT